MKTGGKAKKLISKFFRGNSILLHITRKEFRLGHTIKAAAFALYTYPIRKLLTLENAFTSAPREYYEELHELLQRL